MDDENAIGSTTDEATSTNDGLSCSASDPTVVVKNGARRNDAATSSDAPYTDHVGDYFKKVSIGSAASVVTPEQVHVLGLRRENTPQAPSSPVSVESTVSEVERLRREAEEIKAEQQRLQEEIRMAKRKREELAKEVGAIVPSEDDDPLEIICENPMDVMSAITEDHRTLMLEGNDAEVMSQITEARTEARHFRNLQKKKQWIAVFAAVLLIVVVAVIAGVVRSRRNGEDSENSVEETNESMAVVDSKPTMSPILSPTPSFNVIYASKVKLQSNKGDILNIFEVKVLDPSGVNVAANKAASQSTTWEENYASNAVDEMEGSYSSTLSEEGAWWQVDLGRMTAIESVTIVNYWCFDESDQANCLDRLSNSTVMLIDQDDTVVATMNIGDAAGVLELTCHFDAADETECKAPYVGIGTPSSSPIQIPTLLPSSISTCSSDQGILSVFFVFGQDPSQISWNVAEECTGIIVAECDQCYQNEEPNSTSHYHSCLPLKGYTFNFVDSAGGVWPIGTGYTVVFDGNSQSVEGDGGILSSDTSMSLGGDGLSCQLPTTEPTTFDNLPFPFPYPYTRFTQWDLVNDTTRYIAQNLGYNSTFWDEPNSFDLEYNYIFVELNSTMQQDIYDLDMTQEQWDCYMNHYESYGWDYLPESARQALVYLGWDQCNWDKLNCSTGAPSSESSTWSRLYEAERAAAVNLCWFKNSWDSYSLPW